MSPYSKPPAHSGAPNLFELEPPAPSPSRSSRGGGPAAGGAGAALRAAGRRKPPPNGSPGPGVWFRGGKPLGAGLDAIMGLDKVSVGKQKSVDSMFDKIHSGTEKMYQSFLCTFWVTGPLEMRVLFYVMSRWWKAWIRGASLSEDPRIAELR